MVPTSPAAAAQDGEAGQDAPAFVPRLPATRPRDGRCLRSGLLTEDREPKVPAETIRRILTRPARSVPAEAIDAARRAARGR
ncbi:hypothetical protein ABT120_40295 [Nonomuraea angiospora]|uniref:hypothetical protein n=1 Tax=Nonomuraea angiospora TaxID=46172 RepID=UPI0033315658